MNKDIVEEANQISLKRIREFIYHNPGSVVFGILVIHDNSTIEIISPDDKDLSDLIKAAIVDFARQIDANP